MPVILAYHKISYDKEFGINTIIPDIFEHHIEQILAADFTPITFKQLEQNQSIKPIIITFDDGYESVHSQALPILKKFGIPAVVFIVSNYIGKSNAWESFPIQRSSYHLNKTQLLELQEQGCEIGSHSRFHNYLPALSDEMLKMEINDSKSMIEQICDAEVISFCYPYGQYNKRVTEAVGLAGYRYATCNIRLGQTGNRNLTMRRRSIYQTDQLASFKKKLAGETSTFNWSAMQEWFIQRGTIPGITMNIIKNLKF